MGQATLVRTLTTAYEALAELNPFRYRGYVYDEETGLYYLQDRRYDPVTVRFPNSDRYIGFKKSLKRLNMFAYCGNNPVNCYDPTGKSLLNAILSIGISLSSILLLSRPCPNDQKSTASRATVGCRVSGTSDCCSWFKSDSFRYDRLSYGCRNEQCRRYFSQCF